MSTESASSWERVPSDYDIVSSPSDSMSDSRPISRNYSPVEDVFDFEPEIKVAPALPLHSPKIILQPTKNPPMFTAYPKAPVFNPYRGNALDDLQPATGEIIDNNSFSKMQWYMMILCFIGGVADGVELMCVSFVLPHIRCSFGLSAVQNAILSSVGFIGLLIGGLLWGSLGDKWGRSVTLSVCLAVNATFGLTTAMANNFPTIMISRFLAGIGVGGSSLLFTYASEISPRRRVGFYLSILATSWMVANIVTSALAYVILPIQLQIGTWRIFVALCTIPAIISSILFISAPESPFWLASQGRVTDLIYVLTIFYPSESFKKIETLKPYERVNSISSPSLSSLLVDLDFIGPISELLSPTIIRRAVPLWIINFCTSFGFYGLSLWLPTIYGRMEGSPDESFCDAITNSSSQIRCDNVETKQYMDSLLFALIQLPGNMITMLFIDKIGPKRILAGSLFFNSFVTLSLLYSGSAWQSFLLSILFSASSVFCWNSLNVCNTALVPTKVRSFATGSFNASNRLGGLFGSLLIGVFIESGCSNSVFSLFTTLILGGICATRLPKS